MLEEAKIGLKQYSQIKSFVVGHAEAAVFTASEFDLVMIGSAWHWMDPIRMVQRLENWVKPGGLVYIFEYQFPRAVDARELNEWVRRQFNLKWRVNGQKPRGTLRELVEPLNLSPSFDLKVEAAIDQTATLSPEQFIGAVRSQSRYLDFEHRTSPDEVMVMQRELETKIIQFFEGALTMPFFYRMQGFGFIRG